MQPLNRCCLHRIPRKQKSDRDGCNSQILHRSQQKTTGDSLRGNSQNAAEGILYVSGRKNML